MRKFLFILKVLCVCLCISAIFLMVNISNLDHITKRDLFNYTACGVVAVATFISYKALGKIERQNKIINHIDTDFLKKSKKSL